MKKFLFIPLLFILLLNLRADEGMWIPLLLEKYNIQDMQDKGLKLSAADIYNINNASLKDAVVLFGGSCTGEVVSDQGLLFTNHHCGYRYIQSHSSVENDYLTNGFWAMSLQEEIPNPDLNVSFLDRIEDVTERVLEGTENELTERSRQTVISRNIEEITAPLSDGKFHKAEIKPFYYGNEYYMFVYKIFTDVRLVGAPPGSIGNYGKDYDNWMWPRHTGDFSIFRIYAGPDNEPADYSPNNVPYKPKKYLPISLDGYEEGDFTMVMGYPASTTQYYTADAVQLIEDKSYPKKIALRDTRLEIMEKYMNSDEKIRIQYAAKYRSVSNAWKKWQGVIKGLSRADALEQKILNEEKFTRWVGQSEEREQKYGNILGQLENLYSELSKYLLVYEYASEAVLAVEILNYALDFNSFMLINANFSDDEKKLARTEFIKKTNSFFKDYHQPLDKEIYTKMLEAFYQDIDPEFHPDIYDQIMKKYKGDFSKFAERQFKKTLFNNKEAIFKLLQDYPERAASVYKKILKDPVFETLLSFLKIYSEEVNARFNFVDNEIQRAYRIYMQGLREMNTGQILYPDANFTMRVAYGKIEGYSPKNAVIYNYETTLSGVIEKYNTGLADYTVPQKLIDLYNEKDYGNYASEDGHMNVCFIASNHTSGGNSGSPVLNAEGHLIGLNFDRNWEGTMSDIYYDISQCRNISVDIRYVLFIIDKYANADHLLEELEIVNSE